MAMADQSRIGPSSDGSAYRQGRLSPLYSGLFLK